MKPWAVFLDRDGTLNEEIGLLWRPDDLKLLPGAGKALKALKEAGALLVVTTNQPVVARGLIDEAGLGRIHARLEDLLAAEGAKLDLILYCPHHPERHHPEATDPKYRRDCDCRKPRTGMIKTAVERLGIDLSRSFLVGDSTRDMKAAKDAGVTGVLVKTGNGGADGHFEAAPDATCADVAAAAEWIVARVKKAAAR